MNLKIKNLFLILNLNLFLKLVTSDCGLPAIPFNAQIDKIKITYDENETVKYHCELEDLKLIGNNSRTCLGSKWVGNIPRCVEELHAGTISAIDLSDNRNHTVKIKGNWKYWDRGSAFSNSYKRGKCLSTTKMTATHFWKLHLRKAQRHISYIELSIYDKLKQLARTDADRIIKAARINDMRECLPAILSRNEESIRLSLTCHMEFEGESKFEAWEKDVTQVINFEFDVDDITICEIRIFRNSFFPFHRCGSPDVILHSTTQFVNTDNKFGENPYYKHKCNDGFDLQGVEDVRCSPNNQWIDPFPTCKPHITCPFPPSLHESITIDIKPEHIFSFSGNVSAVVGSVVSYYCIADNQNDSVMIGDSVRVCGDDGLWSGSDPFCMKPNLINNEFYEEYKKHFGAETQHTTVESFNAIISRANQLSNACGIPAMPLFAKPTSSDKFKLMGSQSDLRQWYANGTTIYYQCESAYRWVNGDVDKRVCVDGKWVGRVGKCAINWGNKIRLSTIYAYDEDNSGKWINQHYVTENNESTILDDHFAYRKEPSKGECATFTVESRHRWSLRLNQSTTISYFMVMFHPGGFFGHKRKIYDQTILGASPITAELHNKPCLLTSAWDYSYSRIGTFFFFTCDMEERKYKYTAYENTINIYIDPKKFTDGYRTTNISLCSLAVMVSKNDCGTPDVPLYGYINYDSNAREWKYACVEGYELVGAASVSCGMNGRWNGDFPSCQRRALCPTPETSIGYHIDYNHLGNVSQKLVPILDSLAEYSCITDPNNNKVRIGSSLRICTKTRTWSGTKPLCIEPSALPQSKPLQQTPTVNSTAKTFSIVISSLILIIGLIGVLYYAHIKGMIKMPAIRIPDINIPKRNANSVNTLSNNNENFEDPVNNVEQPKVKSCNINNNLPAFPTGKECLVEPDSSDA